MRKKLDSLQAFRAVAAILVVLYHVTAFSQETGGYVFMGGIFAFGYTGVDFFFVLSGFIIFFTHGRDLGNRSRFGTYVVRRLTRIYPFFWLIFAAKMLAILAMSGYGKSYERELGVIVKSFLLLPQENLPIIGAAWTLSFELMFYLIFGLSILLGRRFLLAAFVAWQVGIFGLAIFDRFSGVDGAQSYLLRFALNARNLEFMLGVLSCYIVTRSQPRYRDVIAVAGLGLYLIGGFYVNGGGSLDAMGHALIFGLASTLIVVGVASREFRQTMRVPGLLVFLGDASYSIYLSAFALVNLLTLLLLRPSVVGVVGPSVAMLVIAVLAVVGGSVAHVVVERPLLDLMRRYFGHSRPAPVPAGAHRREVAPSISGLEVRT
jgi:exopolysaccharide production protein ExoZ